MLEGDEQADRFIAFGLAIEQMIGKETFTIEAHSGMGKSMHIQKLRQMPSFSFDGMITNKRLLLII